MASYKLIALFALLAIVNAQDYDGGFGGGDDGGDGGFGGQGDGGYGGGDGGYGGGDGGDGGFGGGDGDGGYAAAGSAPGQGQLGGQGQIGGQSQMGGQNQMGGQYQMGGQGQMGDQDAGLGGFDGAASAPILVKLIPRAKRSVNTSANDVLGSESHKSLSRVRRGQHYYTTAPPPTVGPVYTYVKTDYHGHFKWGARHRVAVPTPAPGWQGRRR